MDRKSKVEGRKSHQLSAVSEKEKSRLTGFPADAGAWRPLADGCWARSVGSQKNKNGTAPTRQISAISKTEYLPAEN
jgi:hypothetical protein